MSLYSVFFFALAFIFATCLAHIVRSASAKREMSRLVSEAERARLSSTVEALQTLGSTARSAAASFTVHHCNGCRCYELIGAPNPPERFPSVEPDDYADNDKDGVPDAFQRRKPLSEILEFEKPSGNHSNDYWVAVELPARSPREGEYFIHDGKIEKAFLNYGWPKRIIIKSVLGTNLDDLVDLTK